jgi:erythromycin esterase-like protein
MARSDDHLLAGAIAASAHILDGSPDDLEDLVELAGPARYVLIGESSHGTHEFYRLRAQITKRLIAEKGFVAVAVEGDWPDSYRVNRWVRGQGGDRDATEALRGYQRFPAWMWRNADVLDFIGWLRAYNERSSDQAGFYGLDLYSLHASMAAVLQYLDQADPQAARRARQRYGCFEQFGDDPQAYGYAAGLGLTESCEREVISQLIDLRQQRDELLRHDGLVAEDELFHAEQNARVVKNAEEYYRVMFRGRVSSWNLRDAHMADTLDQLAAHLGAREGRAKVVVWAHNSHVGDARATEMGRAGELNIGQLARERHPDKTCLIGFSTHRGTVTAASDWGGAAERKRVRPGLPGSYEALFHQIGRPSFSIILGDLGEVASGLRVPRLQRAIGVIYRPETERASHYFHARLPDQFDALIHLDETRAVEPLEVDSRWEAGELPETYPSGM